MAEDWENLTYTRSWMKQPKKKPDWVTYGLKKNEQNQPDKMFEIALQPPMCYPKGNCSNRIPLALDHKKYVVELNQTWLTYCNLGYKLDEEIKAKGLDFELERKIRQSLTPTTMNEKQSVKSKITELTDLWHK